MPSPADRRPGRTLPASAVTTLVVVLLLAATAVATLVAHRGDLRAERDDQRALADRAEAIVESRGAAMVARVEDLAQIVEVAHGLDGDEFARRGAALLRGGESVGVGLVEAVTAAERARWEADNGPIFETAGRRARRRAVHYVLTQSVYADGGRSSGIDVRGDLRRFIALALTLHTGRTQATPEVRLLPSGRPGIVVYARVSDGPRRAVVTGGYALDRLVAGVRETLPRNAAVRLAGAGAPARALREPVNRAVGIAGRRFVLEVGRRDLGRGEAPLVALGGLGLVFLVGTLGLQAARRERYAADLVARRMAERDRSEEAREAAERHFADAFEASPIGMQIVAPDGTIERVNGAMVQISGYPRDQLQGMRALDLVHPEDRAREGEAAERLVRGDLGVASGDRRCLHALGDIVWVSVNTTTLTPAAGGEAPRLLMQVQDITERRRYEAQLQYLADHDPLTGLLNRRAFEREVHRHLVHVARYGPQGAVVVLDVDDFKSVNDTLGHSAGDALIIDVGQTLRSRLRESDVLARLGGDEFAVLLPEVGPADAATVTEDVLRGIRGLRVRRGDGRLRSVSTSAGVALLGPGEPGGRSPSVDDVLVRADLAMYEAKEAGGDRLALHRPEEAGEEPRVLARLTWADRIRTALDEDRFVLHAQPIVDLDTGGVHQHELLLRMLDEVGEIIAPGTFLHVAERVGLMPQIDRWVVRRALELLAERPDMTLEVNLSGASTGDAEVLRLIETGLKAKGVEAARLIFEVTETVAISNIPRAQHFATRLGELGCRFALDDFGAGFGSFYYLKHLPFDVLKIDGEFVRHCTTSTTDQVLIRAVVDIARGLGKRTVAEHVGDDETVALLRELGIDLGQGFHLGRPAPLAAELAA